MRRSTTLLCSVAAATLALAVPVPRADVGLYPAAQAATNISISIGSFYDDLSPYGSWVHYENAYVFVPSGVRPGWRPYTVGHWVYTRQYGWLWVSDEPFGWATYHYGRWGFSEDIGWYWVPGRRWAPAWVSWRRSSGYVVWAPLPPRFDDDFSIEITVGDIPDHYWVAVPSRSFLEVDLSVSIIDDDRERVRVVQETEPVGNVTIQDNIVVNTVLDVNFVEKETKQKVTPVPVKETDDPTQAGKGGDGGVAVFTGEVKADNDAKPPEVKEVDEVKKEEAKQEEAPGTAGETEQPQGGKKKKKLQTDEQITTPEQPQPQAGEEQPTGKKAKTEETQSQPGAEQPAKKKKKATGQAEEEQPQQGQEQPVKKKKEATGQPTQSEEEQPQQGQEQPVRKKKKAAEQPSEGTEPLQNSEEPIETKKSKKEKAQPEPEAPEIKPKNNVPASECDPATGEGCAQ